MALVVMTPRAQVASARVRLLLETPLSLAALEQPRRDLLHELTPELQRVRQVATEAAG